MKDLRSETQAPYRERILYEVCLYDAAQEPLHTPAKHDVYAVRNEEGRQSKEAATMTNITLTRGDTQELDLVASSNGSPLNLTGASIWFTVKPDLAGNDASALFQKTVGSGVEVIDASKGVFTVTILPADTVNVAILGQGTRAKNTYYWDVQVRLAGGATHTLLSGVLYLVPDVTRS